MKIEYDVAVVGLGYIGLPTAIILANKNIKVLGVDINEKLLDELSSRKYVMNEPGFTDLLDSSYENGNLTFSNIPSSSSFYLIAVPTPLLKNNMPDISNVLEAINSISRFLKKGDTIIIESTCPVGTTRKISKLLSKKRSDLKFPTEYSSDCDINLCYCPERVIPGNILEELVDNNRVIGGITNECSKKGITFYKKFVKGECTTTTCETAEMCKLAENSFRDVNIAFANELSMIADIHNVNVWELIEHANQHPRVDILKPGPGVGGHCIAVDPWFLVDSCPDQSKLIFESRRVNKSKTKWVIEKIENLSKKINSETDQFIKLGFFGATYKPNIDDIRESPSLEIISHFMNDQNNKIKIFEPNIKTLPLNLDKKNIKLINNIKDMEDSDIFVILVGHKEFKTLDQSYFRDKVIIDTIGLFN